MENPQNYNTNKKKMAVKIRGGGGGGAVGGLILLGGALATAALLSTLEFKRRKRQSSSTDDKSNLQQPLKKKEEINNQDEESKGFSFLLPADSSPLPSINGSGTIETNLSQSEPIFSVSGQNLILDEKPKLEINGGKVLNTSFRDEEILNCNSPKHPEHNSLFDESRNTEEVSFPILEGPSLLKPQNLNNKDEEHSEEIGVIMKDNEEIANETIVVDDYQNVSDKNEEDGETLVPICEELAEVGVEAANLMQFGENQENSMAMNNDTGDQEMICPASSLTEDKPEFSSQALDNSSLSKPENDDSASAEAMQIMERDEVTEAPQGGLITVEDVPQVQLIEAEHDDVDEEVSDRKHEEANETTPADHFAVVVEDEQMQLREDQEELINGDQENIGSDKLLPESSSLLNYDVKVEENLSLPVLNSPSPSLSEPENVNKEDSAETALRVEASKPVEEDETTEVILVDQITVDENPSLESENKEEKENFYDNDGGEIVAAKGEEVVQTAHPDIVEVDHDNQQEQSSEEEQEEGENCDDGEIIVTIREAVVQTFQPDIVEVDHDNQQEQLSEEEQEEEEEYDDDGEIISAKGKEVLETAQSDIVEVDNHLRKQSSEKEQEEEEDCDDNEDGDAAIEEDDAEKVEESSETTGDSSMDSNAEAIWPAESMLELSMKLQTNYQTLAEAKEEDRMVKNEEHNFKTRIENDYFNENHSKMNEEKRKLPMSISKKFMMEIAALKQPLITFQQSIWTRTLLVALWCFCYWKLGLLFLKLSLIVISSVVLLKSHLIGNFSN